MARGSKMQYGDQNGKNNTNVARRRDRVPGDGVADWAACDGTLLAKAIAAVAKTGAAIRLGYTRDGGAYAIGYYDGDDKHTEYVRPGEDMNEYLKEVIEDYTA